MTRCLPDYFLDLDSSRPVTDRKHYRLGLIPGSGLEVLLVQTDGRRGRAAAALTVGVGSFSDPEGLEVSTIATDHY
jgi:secreted Zn-dependent insulinase-like peptidase